ncbi:DUF4139 domain-containing protein [Ruegeria sp. SCP11]|uniref:DUF4139 domain-containing protein n=1 Tax=Ruegeria sp. SCP11 TaxID=3141378 RepID=UPI00333C78B5
MTAEAARQKIAFLSNLGRNEGLAGSDADALRSIARMVGDESLEAEAAAQSAEIQARNVEFQLEDLEIELEAAQANLVALLPETEDLLFVAVDVTAQTATQGSLSLSYLNLYEANWYPGYEFDLTTGETPEVQITRRVLVSQDTGENWQNVKLNVSTLQPAGQNSASRMNSRRMFIREKVVQKPASDSFGNLEEPVVEAPVIVEETQGFMIDPSSVQGTGVTYTLPNPISISSGQSIAEFELDSLTQSAEVFALATPRYDDTAYRTARFTNPYDQNLLASSLARYLVNGALVAADIGPEIGPGEEIELGFGPLYGLVVDRDVLSRSSGDVGLISRSNEDLQRAQIQVENLTNETWPLRVIDRVPFSEQSDLEISWTANPIPTDENVDNKRGILAWEMELTPGQSKIIELNTTLSWPEGMVLR